jgi:RNA recognition motif-containing protein
MTTASNSSNDRKVKVLLFGPISTQDDWTTFSKKLTALHTSKSGPFHVAFVVGPCAALSHDDTSTSTLTLPIPVYLQEGWNPTSTTTTDDVSLPDGIVLLARNLFWLRGNSRLDQEPCGNIWNLAIPTQPQQQHHLVVAVCPRLFRSTDDEDAYLLTQLRHASYIGCDLLLTNEGPQGIESTMISPATTTANNNNHTNHNNSWMTSYDVAQVALLARARYHVAASCYNTTSNATGALFAQSHPFAHLPSLSSTRPIRHVGRFLNLAPVSSKKHTTKLDKEQYKFVHALGIIPLQEMTSVDWQEQQPSSQPILPCPFTDASYQLDGTGVSSSTTTTASVGLSEAQARRLIMASYSQSDHNNSRWEMKNSRKRKHAPESGGGKDEAEEDDDITNTTLFVHGMHLDVSGQLQRTDSILLLQAFAKYHALRVRRPQGGGTTTSFAFVEFATHEQAKACLQDHPQGTMVIQGVSLTLKWAKRNANNTKKQQQQQQDAPRKTLLLTEQEAHDSSTLYFRYLDPQEILQDKDSGGNAAEKEEAGSANPVSKLTVVTTACELLRKLMEHTLEQALMGDDDEGAADADAAAAVNQRYKSAWVEYNANRPRSLQQYHYHQKQQQKQQPQQDRDWMMRTTITGRKDLYTRNCPRK